MRENGFYWVRFKLIGSKVLPVRPEIAHWNGVDWPLSGTNETAQDDELEVMSERLSPPGDLAATPLERATGEMFRCAKAEGFTLHMRFSRRRVVKAAPKKKAKR